MSSPPPPLYLQKPLGWLQRFLYNIQAGPIPFPQPTIAVDQDWPLEIVRIQVNFTPIVGTLSVPNVVQTSADQHALVFMLNTVQTGAGGWPANEQASLNLNWNGLAVPIFQVLDLNPFDMFPMIGGAARVTGSNLIKGMPPVYVPPSASLDYTHVSVAGGLTGGLFGVALFRQKSYPLRLP